MKLFYSRGACSIGIHVILEEIGKPYELALTDLSQGAQFTPEFTAVNPKGKVPALLRDDGSLLTEYAAIAYWLAETNPDKQLLPADIEGRTQVLSLLDYIVATIHMQGMSRLFRPGKYAPSEADHAAVLQAGRTIAEKGFAVIDEAIAGKDYAVGAYSIADTALFYTELWAEKRMNIPLPPNCRAHFERMLTRPAVQRALKSEGLA